MKEEVEIKCREKKTHKLRGVRKAGFKKWLVATTSISRKSAWSRLKV